MFASQAAARHVKADPPADFDAIIIGAGVSGSISSTSCANWRTDIAGWR
jgi:hypothetical protein